MASFCRVQARMAAVIPPATPKARSTARARRQRILDGFLCGSQTSTKCFHLLRMFSLKHVKAYQRLIDVISFNFNFHLYSRQSGIGVGHIYEQDFPEAAREPAWQHRRACSKVPDVRPIPKAVEGGAEALIQRSHADQGRMPLQRAKLSPQQLQRSLP